MNVCRMFSIIAIIWLILGFTGVMNVAGHTSDIEPSSQVPTKLVLSAPTVAIGWGVYVTADAHLTTASGAGIANATIHAQTLIGGTDWITFLDITTEANGHISFAFAPKSPPPGTNYAYVNFYRVTYDGGSQYASTVSNEVSMYVKWV